MTIQLRQRYVTIGLALLLLIGFVIGASFFIQFQEERRLDRLVNEMEIVIGNVSVKLKDLPPVKEMQAKEEIQRDLNFRLAD